MWNVERFEKQSKIADLNSESRTLSELESTAVNSLYVCIMYSSTTEFPEVYAVSYVPWKRSGKFPAHSRSLITRRHSSGIIYSFQPSRDATASARQIVLDITARNYILDYEVSRRVGRRNSVAAAASSPSCTNSLLKVPRNFLGSALRRAIKVKERCARQPMEVLHAPHVNYRGIESS